MINTLNILNYKNYPCIYVVVRMINGFVDISWAYKCGTTSLHPNRKKSKYSGLHHRLSDFRTMSGADGVIEVLCAWGWDESKYPISGLQIEGYWHELMSEYRENKEFYGKGITEKQIIKFAEQTFKDFGMNDVIRIHENQKTVNNKTSNIIGDKMQKRVNPFDAAVGLLAAKENNMELFQRVRGWAGNVVSTSSTGVSSTHASCIARADERATTILDKSKVISDTNNLVSISELAKRYFPSILNPDYSTTIGGKPGSTLSNGCDVYRSSILDVKSVKSNLGGNRKTFMTNLFVDEDTANEIVNSKG